MEILSGFEGSITPQQITEYDIYDSRMMGFAIRRIGNAAGNKVVMNDELIV